MVDVPLRHRNAKPPEPAGLPAARAWWVRPITLIAAGILVIIAIGGLFKAAIELYRERQILTGLSASPAPVRLAIAGEQLTIPGNMLRFAKTRRGGPVETADLALHWPKLEGYSESLAYAFKDGEPSAPVIYATIMARETEVDATGRLDTVYARFFIDKPLPGPTGLVGRRLGKDSGYDGEIVYFAPSEPRPFVARCLAESTPEVPATCLRDVNFGRGLSVLYRFNRNLLGEWRALDAGIQKMVARFLGP